jgi:hypothetical protein
MKLLDFYKSHFYFGKVMRWKKYRLTKWNIICQPKYHWGLGIELLDILNRCLLSKWLFKLLTGEGVWQELLHTKYLRDKTLFQVQAKPTYSPF